MLDPLFLCDEELGLRQGDLWGSSRRRVNVFQMAAKVAALSKVFVTEGALEGSEFGVLAEVVPQIAALLEDCCAARVLASELKSALLGVIGGIKSDDLMPLLRDTFKSLVEGLSIFEARLIVGEGALRLGRTLL